MLILCGYDEVRGITFTWPHGGDGSADDAQNNGDQSKHRGGWSVHMGQQCSAGNGRHAAVTPAASLASRWAIFRPLAFLSRNCATRTISWASIDAHPLRSFPSEGLPAAPPRTGP